VGDLYQETAGSGPIHLEAGDYTLRLELQSGDPQNLNFSKLDQVIFVYDDTPVTRTTWGAIKRLYSE